MCEKSACSNLSQNFWLRASTPSLSKRPVCKCKTSIPVAHRLATAVNADKIFVFQDGHIAETGTHKSLLKKNGIYADLAKYQLQ